MKRIFRHWWLASLVGLFFGIPTGIALEFARRAYNDAATAHVAREFESQGMSPPLMIDNIQPWVVPILTSIIFAMVALVIYVIVRACRVSYSGNS